jgi:hypothetical protein
MELLRRFRCLRLAPSPLRWFPQHISLVNLFGLPARYYFGLRFELAHTCGSSLSLLRATQNDLKVARYLAYPSPFWVTECTPNRV